MSRIRRKKMKARRGAMVPTLPNFALLLVIFALQPPTTARSATTDDTGCDGSKFCPDAKQYRAEVGEILKKTELEADQKTKTYGNTGAAAFGDGQGQGTRDNVKGLITLSKTMNAYAEQLSERSKEIAASQVKLATESFTTNPGSNNPDARKFFAATDSGKNLNTGITSAANPTVKEQIAAYDHMGNTRKLLEQESQKYRDRASQFREMAAENARNAAKLDSKGDSGGPSGGGSGGGGSPQSAQAQPQPQPNPQAGNPTSGMNGAQSSSAPDSAKDSGDSKLVSANADNKNVDVSALARRAGARGNAITTGKTAAGGEAALRDSLESGKSSTGERATSATKATAAGGGGGGKANGGSSGSPEGAPASSASADNAVSMGGGRSGGGGGGGGSGSDEPLTPFGRPLSDPKFSMPGGEVDGSINGLIGDGAEDAGDTRTLASEFENGIGERDGPSLFDRCHATHTRCAQAGCVKPGNGGS